LRSRRNGLQRKDLSVLPKIEGRVDDKHREICFAEELRLQISFFDCLFPSRLYNVQRKQHLSFQRMHMSKVWAPMIDALNTDGKGKDHPGDTEFELHSQASLPDYVYLI
jgi:hypothetical protein